MDKATLVSWVMSLALKAGFVHTGMASNFGWEDDERRGGEAVCLHRELRPNELGVAVRDLPCGTRVMIINPRTGLSVVARVIDHGPYGAIHKGHWVVKRREEDRGEWRGVMDLTQATARRIKHNGMEPIMYYVVARK